MRITVYGGAAGSEDLFRRLAMQTESIKQQAHQLLDNLPESATWEDLMYRIYVRQAIEAGIKDSDQGRTLDVKDVRKKFNLPA